MRVQAVVTPPETLLHGLVPTFAPPPPPPRRRLSVGRRRDSPTTPPVEFVPLPPDEVHVRVASLGNLTRTEVQGMVDAWAQSPVRGALVHVAGLELQEQGGLVVAQLGGELDALKTFVDNFKRVAQRRGIMLDRRDFRPQFVVGALHGADDDPDTARQAVQAVQAAPGAQWRVEWISLLQETFSDGTTVWRELGRLPLDPL